MNARKELSDFTEMQERKLQKNDHKPHWSNSSIEYLFKRLKDEVAELEVEIKKGNQISIGLEAIDVGNFAMMIYDNAKNGRMKEVIKITSEEYVKLSYDCACGFRLRLVKHMKLYQWEKQRGMIEEKKVCEQCKNKVMKLTEKIFHKPSG